VGEGPLTDIGGGYASGGYGILWFHGQEVHSEKDMRSLVSGNLFYNAGNGYGLAQGMVFYCGKQLDITVSVHDTELEHLGDGWSRTPTNSYLFRGEAMSKEEGRRRCPYFAEYGDAAVKAEGGTVDHEYLKPDEQRLGAYSSAGYDGAVYYKGKRVGEGPLTDIGGGYASGGHGILWFHGQEVHGQEDMRSLVSGHQFHNAGNGYGLARGMVFYCGKQLDIDGAVNVHETKLDHLGDGWSRTAANNYLFRGEVMSKEEARVRCPYYAEYGEAAGP